LNRSYRTRATILLLLLSCLAISPRSLLAHAELRQATPVPGAQLEELPPEIRLVFNEPLSPGSTFEIFDQGFRPVTSVHPGIDQQMPEQLWAKMPDLEPGKYTVQWTAKGLDGHPSSGSYAFQVIGPANSGLVRWAAYIIVFTVIVIILLLSLRYLRRPQLQDDL